MKRIEVRLGINSYNICIGSGLLTETGRQLKEMGFSDKLVIITDSKVKGLYGNTISQDLNNQGFKVITLEVPEGEEP